MKPIISILLIMLLALGCQNKASRFSNDITWISSQILCVYWSSSFKGRDTLPAINFILETNNDLTQKTTFVFQSPIGNNIKKIRLIKKHSVYTENKAKLGLALLAKDLYTFFKEDIHEEDGPCYVESLCEILGQGELYMLEGGNKTEIGKAPNFHFKVGLYDQKE